MSSFIGQFVVGYCCYATSFLLLLGLCSSTRVCKDYHYTITIIVVVNI